MVPRPSRSWTSELRRGTRYTGAGATLATRSARACSSRSDAAAWRVWWRGTTEPQWQRSRDVPGSASSLVLKDLVVDDWFFGVSAISPDGFESPVVFPGDAGAF